MYSNINLYTNIFIYFHNRQIKNGKLFRIILGVTTFTLIIRIIRGNTLSPKFIFLSHLSLYQIKQLHHTNSIKKISHSKVNTS